MNRGPFRLYRKRVAVLVLTEPDLNFAPRNGVNERPSYICEPP